MRVICNPRCCTENLQKVLLFLLSKSSQVRPNGRISTEPTVSAIGFMDHLAALVCTQPYPTPSALPFSTRQSCPLSFRTLSHLASACLFYLTSYQLLCPSSPSLPSLSQAPRVSCNLQNTILLDLSFLPFSSQALFLLLFTYKRICSLLPSLSQTDSSCFLFSHLLFQMLFHRPHSI